MSAQNHNGSTLVVGFLRRFELHMVGGLLAVYFALYSWLAVQRHETYHSFGLDLAVFDQVFWNTIHGRFVESTMSLGLSAPHSFFSDHFSPILLVLLPLYAVWPQPESLLVAQTAALAAGMLPVYLVARARLDPGWERLLWVIAYFLYLPVAYINLFDFHEIALVVLPVGMALYFLDRGRYVLMVLMVAIALLAKEEMGAFASALGLYLILSRRAWATGVAMVAGGVSYSTAVVWLVIPAFGKGHQYFYLAERYGYLGATPAQIAKNAVTHPLKVLDALLQGHKISFVAGLFGPVLGAPFFSGWALVIPVIGLSYLVLSDYAPQSSFATQYSAPLIAVILVTAIWGYARLPGKLRRSYGFGILAASVAASAAFGDLPFSRHFDRAEFSSEQRYEAFQAALASIPSDASVSSENNVTPHLSHRRFIYAYEYEKTAGAEYVVLDSAAVGDDPRKHDAEVASVAAQGYRVVASATGLALLRRS